MKIICKIHDFNPHALIIIPIYHTIVQLIQTSLVKPYKDYTLLSNLHYTWLQSSLGRTNKWIH